MGFPAESLAKPKDKTDAAAVGLSQTNTIYHHYCENKQTKGVNSVRTGVVFVLTAVLVCPPAWAADYEVPVSGTLAKAIAAANANTDGDTYEIEIAGSSADSGTVRKSASITGDSTARLSGSLTFTGTGVKSALDNLSFTAGSGTAVTNGTLGFGEAQDLTVNNVSFSQRTGGYYGGAFANLGNTEINGSSFTGNRGNLGGAVYTTSKTLTVNNTSFSDNSASDNGGAVNNWGTLSISGSSFERNRSGGSYGGAVYTKGKTTITDTVFSANTAAEGGAVYAYDGKADLTVADSRFIGNYTSVNQQGTSNYGGAIYGNGKINVSQTLFEGNHATEAGAVKIGRTGSESVFTGSEFKENYAEIRDGGAIVHSGGKLTVGQTSFTGNKSLAGSGGAILTESTLNITGNSRFLGNTAARGGGAIQAIYGANVTVDGASFDNNGTQSGNGGAVNASSVTPLSVSNASFVQNYTGKGHGGAIYASGTTFIDNASFSRNRTDNGYGGALYASGETVLQNVVFDGNTAIYGGAVISSDNLTIGGNSSFTGNKAEAGGALFAEGKLTLDTSEGDILFSGNTATNINEGGADVYLNNKETAVVIEGDANTLSMDGGFAGVGSIDKNGANTLIFDQNADNRLFVGDFTQTAGTTLVYADNFFGGKNTVAEGSVLHFADNAAVNNLRLQTGGRLDLRRTGPFAANTVTITDLISDGSAVVVLQTDGTDADLLKITGSADGMITLDVRAAGSNPTKKEIEVVNTEEASGNAEFKLAGGKVDIGAHEYGLTHGEDANWYLETEGELTKTAKSVETMPALHLSIVNAGMNELRKRLGDLRSGNPDAPAGVWVRGYGKRLRVHERTGARLNMLGMEGGIDAAAELFGGRTYLGVMGGYLSANDIRVFQSGAPDAKGHTKTPVAGLYATWLPHNSPWFVDLTARHFWVHTDLDNLSGGNRTNGYDIKRGFWAFTAETGRLFDFDAPRVLNAGSSLITFEPKIELRYVHGEAKDFTTDNGEIGSIDSTSSLVSRFNLQTSYLPEGRTSNWKLFLELGLYNEWIGRTKVKFADTRLTTSDLSGLGFEASLGFNAAVAEDAYCYGAVTLEAGEAYTSYQLNAGLRVSF